MDTDEWDARAWAAEVEEALAARSAAGDWPESPLYRLMIMGETMWELAPKTEEKVLTGTSAPFAGRVQLDCRRIVASCRAFRHAIGGWQRASAGRNPNEPHATDAHWPLDRRNIVHVLRSRGHAHPVPRHTLP